MGEMMKRDGSNGGKGDEGPLFETRGSKGRNIIYRGLALSVLMAIFLIWLYRLQQLPESGTGRRWAWIGMFISELFFSFFWVITQSVRWNVVHRFPFRDRLLHSYRDKLPNVDVFVCTADPKLEPPSLVINTVLSAMAYNYPPEKFTVYLSDDGGSDLTFYAMIEASKFSKLWVPFCTRFLIEPRSPQAYFAQSSVPAAADGSPFSDQWHSMKKLYEEMKLRIDEVSEKGSVPMGLRDQHEGFKEWNSEMTKQNHPSIVQILIDLDEHGVNEVPRLVYLAREKKPDRHHNFKAGSMNALLRVSSIISNAPIILNVDCDMYSNDSNAILDALCFFMDEEQGHTFAFVQHPQYYSNITKNDIYAGAGHPIHMIELAGMGGYGSALYCGTGCFHRRVSLCGSKYVKTELKNGEKTQKPNHELEEAAKVVANCSYEDGSQWGKEMGVKYGCVVEDVITGLSIQCRGWKSIYYYPEGRKSFMGLAPTTLDQSLVQQKRWCEGLSQIFFSKYCPFIYGRGKIKIGAQMGYSLYLLWAPLSLFCLYYTTIPSIYLLRGIPLFPQPRSPWFLAFAYVYLARNVCSVYEALTCGDSVKAWINAQRMWLVRRTTSYAFALFDTMGRALGFSETSFAITAKVMDEDQKKRYEEEILEFGSESIMFTMLSTLAVLNLVCLVGGTVMGWWRGDILVGQTVICMLVVGLYLPVYEALFLREDNGRIPSSVMIKSLLIASTLCIITLPVSS